MSYGDWMKISRGNNIVFDETIEECREKYISPSKSGGGKQAVYRIVEGVK